MLIESTREKKIIMFYKVLKLLFKSNFLLKNCELEYLLVSRIQTRVLQLNKVIEKIGSYFFIGKVLLISIINLTSINIIIANAVNALLFQGFA